MAENNDQTVQATTEDQQQIRLRIDQSKMNTSYTNGFQTNTTAEEVMLSFGLNQAVPGAEGKPELVMQVSDRIVMNYFTAKRLAIALSQAVRRHEEQFGELELDVQKRAKK